MDNSEVLVVVEITALHDPETMLSYQARARAQIGQWGGVVLARGSAPYEGVPPFGAVMVQRWPSRQAFVDWQNQRRLSTVAEYANGRSRFAHRHSAAGVRTGGYLPMALVVHR